METKILLGTLIATAKFSDIDPCLRLVAVLRQTNDHSASRLYELPP